MRQFLLVVFLVSMLVPVFSVAQEIEKNSMPQKVFAIPKENIRPLVTNMGGAFATDRIMVQGKKIGYMYCEVASRPEDSGWRFFAGDEEQSYIDDLSHTGVYSVNTISNYDADIIPYLSTPAPCAFEKIPGSNRYRLVEE